MQPIFIKLMNYTHYIEIVYIYVCMNVCMYNIGPMEPRKHFVTGNQKSWFSARVKEASTLYVHASRNIL